MSTWKDEDEYGDIEESVGSNGFGAASESNANAGLPSGVIDRLNAYAERVGKKLSDVVNEFITMCKEYSPDPANEDEDLLIDWAEQLVVETRRASGGGNSKLQTWVGSFVGVADKKADRLANIVRANLKLFKNDPEQAISSGRLGVYSKTDGVWHLTTKDGTATTEIPVEGNSVPPHGIKHDNMWVCLTTYDNKAAPSKKLGRYAYFLGGEEEDFVKNGNIALWRIDLTGEHVYHNLTIGRPCKVQVVPPRDNASEAFKDVLSIYSDFEVNYTDEFVSEDLRSLLHPSRFWTNTDFHELYVQIDSLEEAYEERKQFYDAGGERRSYGPLVVTKGTVTRMSTEPRESEYDDEGHNYNMTLSSSISGDIDCWVPGAVGKCSQPFVSHWGEDSFPYAERSTVFVFGRIGMKTRDGLTTPKLTVFGVYADPRRSRRRMTGGDTGTEQFN
jgi:hypothetical protein